MAIIGGLSDRAPAEGRDAKTGPFPAASVLLGQVAPAQEEPLVFPVPDKEGSPRSARFFDVVYLAWEGVQHLGIDIPAPQGNEVVSPVDGTVAVNRANPAGPFAA